MAVVVAPAIGPTLGGWITDNFNWHWIFFINLPIGAAVAVSDLAPGGRSAVAQTRSRSGIRVDYIGLALIVLGVACLPVRPRQRAGGRLVRISADPHHASASDYLLLVAFFLWEWYHDDPIVDVRLLKNRNFGTAVFFSFTLGMVLFGSTVLIPEFLQTSLGYTAERAGMALSPAGFVLMLMMPIAGRITATKVDPRLLIPSVSWARRSSLYRLTIVNLQIDFHTIV